MKSICDLEERSYQFAKNCRHYIKQLPKTMSNLEDSKQLIKASGSLGINIIFIKDSDNINLSNVKNSLRKAEKIRYWLRLLNNLNPEFTDHFDSLLYDIEVLKKHLHSLQQEMIL